MFQYVMTSPLLFFFLLFLPRYRKLVKVVGEDKKFNAFPVFWDLVMEDVPQLVLPIYEVATKYYWELDAITVVSLTGTALMTLVNSIRVVKGIRKTAKESAASFKKELNSGSLRSGEAKNSNVFPSYN